MAENVKAVKGPGMNVRGPRPKVDNAGKILKRTLGYMMKNPERNPVYAEIDR